MLPVQLIIPIGIPGAGKTTWCQRMFPEYRRVSSDDLRQTIMGDTYDPKRNEEIWEIYFADIQASLHAGVSVVADATNLTARNRRRTLNCVPSEATGLVEYWVHAVVFKNAVQSITRNLNRKGVRQGSQRVPDEAMMNLINLYDQALTDIPNEEYDTVTYIEGWSS